MHLQHTSVISVDKKINLIQAYNAYAYSIAIQTHQIFKPNEISTKKCKQNLEWKDFGDKDSSTQNKMSRMDWW